MAVATQQPAWSRVARGAGSARTDRAPKSGVPDHDPMNSRPWPSVTRSRGSRPRSRSSGLPTSQPAAAARARGARGRRRAGGPRRVRDAEQPRSRSRRTAMKPAWPIENCPVSRERFSETASAPRRRRGPRSGRSTPRPVRRRASPDEPEERDRRRSSAWSALLDSGACCREPAGRLPRSRGCPGSRAPRSVRALQSALPLAPIPVSGSSRRTPPPIRLGVLLPERGPRRRRGTLAVSLTSSTPHRAVLDRPRRLHGGRRLRERGALHARTRRGPAPPLLRPLAPRGRGRGGAARLARGSRACAARRLPRRSSRSAWARSSGSLIENTPIFGGAIVSPRPRAARLRDHLAARGRDRHRLPPAAGLDPRPRLPRVREDEVAGRVVASTPPPTRFAPRALRGARWRGRRGLRSFEGQPRAAELHLRPQLPRWWRWSCSADGLDLGLDPRRGDAHAPARGAPLAAAAHDRERDLRPRQPPDGDLRRRAGRLMLVRPRGLLGTGEVWDRCPVGAAASAVSGGGAARPRRPRPRPRRPEAVEPLLDVRGVSIRFGGLTAVSDFSLELAAARAGRADRPNGAGKTTVFNMLTASTRRATAGSRARPRRAGLAPSATRAARRRAHLPEHPALQGAHRLRQRADRLPPEGRRIDCSRLVRQAELSRTEEAWIAERAGQSLGCSASRHGATTRAGTCRTASSGRSRSPGARDRAARAAPRRAGRRTNSRRRSS